MSQSRVVFQSEESQGIVTGPVQFVLYPQVPELVITTQGGRSCVLRGAELGKLVAWLSEPGYKPEESL